MFKHSERAGRRFRSRPIEIINNLTWLKGSHTTSGFNFRLMHEEDFRNDKVVGSISIPVAQVGAGSFNRVPASQRPPFILPTDVGRYDQHARRSSDRSIRRHMATRDGSLSPIRSARASSPPRT
jgi:hypothetical protein